MGNDSSVRKRKSKAHTPSGIVQEVAPLSGTHAIAREGLDLVVTARSSGSSW